MYPMIAILGAVFFLVLFSQFGSRLSARHALLWWGVCFFILTAALWPALFQGLAGKLGVSLASNLIFAGLILLIIFLLVEQSVEVIKSQRLLREIATNEAARDFMESSQPSWPEQSGLKVLVVLPAYNEQASVEALVRNLQIECQRSSFLLDFCFINDGSDDATEERLKLLAPARFASHPRNMGVAAALLTGMKIAKKLEADYVVQCDADGQHPVGLIPFLVQEAVSRQADLMIGSRYLRNKEKNLSFRFPFVSSSSNVWRKMGGFMIGLAIQGSGVPTKVSDSTSGFRVYSRKAVHFLLRHMPDEYPEPETIALLSWAKMSIGEAKVSMEPRAEGRSTLRGLRSLRYMVKVLSALFGLRLRILFSQLR